MSDERLPKREVLPQRAAVRKPEAKPSPRPQAEIHDGGLTAGPDIKRRSLIGLMVAGIVAAGGVETWRMLSASAPSALPTPDGQIVGPEYLAATLAKQPAPKATMPTTAHGWSNCVSSHAGPRQSGLDLVVAVDTTGSMGGVLNDIKLNLQKLLGSLQTRGGEVRVGIVGYKDLCDREVIRSFPLTSLDAAGISALSAFIAGLRADGGCDWPEKMDAALEAAAGMAWRGTVPSSIVVIADAPAHPADEQAALSIAAAFKEKVDGAQVSLIDTGSGGHQFMSAVPKSGGGQYVTYDGRILNSLFPAVTGCPSVT